MPPTAPAIALRIVGLMSGTSADGVDAALITVSGTGSDARFTLEHFVTVPYPSDIRESLLDAARNYMGVVDLASWHFRLGELFAAAVLEVLGGGTADLVASHGHTVAHLMTSPHRATLQLGSPAVIAERTGITVVSDFRARDIAAGGQGAPLVSYVDVLLLRHAGRSRVLLNLGGIANVTYVPGANRQEQAMAFDTGPGNALIDRAAYRLSGEATYYDAGGAMATRGTVDLEVLEGLLGHPYFRRDPPKATGRDEFGDALADAVIDRMTAAGRSAEDVLATLTAFTARTAAGSIQTFPAVDEVIVAGGGVHNAFLMAQLQQLLGPVRVSTSDMIGIPADAKEAIAFAVMANQTIRGLPANVPGCTGATCQTVLGSITPGSNYLEMMKKLLA